MSLFDAQVYDLCSKPSDPFIQRVCLNNMSKEKQARVYRFHAYGGPENLKLEYEAVPWPPPGHVRVQVETFSLNQADFLFLANMYIEQPALPSKIGYEFAGTVDAIGVGVQSFRPGDRVSSVPAFSVKDYGNFAELTVLPERGLIHTPKSLDKFQASCFTFAYITNYFALFDLGKLEPFQTVLITAATSTTGLAAISMVRAIRGTVIATTRSKAKVEGLLKAGANHVVATEEEDLVERVNSITNGNGADVAYDCVTGAMSEKILQCTRPLGHWIVYGLMDLTPVPFPWMLAVMKSIKLDAMKVFDFTGHRHLNLPNNDHALARATRYVCSGINDGTLPIVIDKVFKGLDKLPEALSYQQKHAGSGKIVVEI